MDDARYASQSARRGLWPPLVIFVVLLVRCGLVGWLLLPGSPVTGPAQPASRRRSRRGLGFRRTPSDLPALPAAPARPADALADWAAKVTAAVDVPTVAVRPTATRSSRCDRATRLPPRLDHAGRCGRGRVVPRSGRRIRAPARRATRTDGRLAGAGRYRRSRTRAGHRRRQPRRGRGVRPPAGSAAADAVDLAERRAPRRTRTVTVYRSTGHRRLLAGAGPGALLPAADLSRAVGWAAALGLLHADPAFATAVFVVADSYGRRTQNIG